MGARLRRQHDEDPPVSHRSERNGRRLSNWTWAWDTVSWLAALIEPSADVFHFVLVATAARITFLSLTPSCTAGKFSSSWWCRRTVKTSWSMWGCRFSTLTLHTTAESCSTTRKSWWFDRKWWCAMMETTERRVGSPRGRNREPLRTFIFHESSRLWPVKSQFPLVMRSLRHVKLASVSRFAKSCGIHAALTSTWACRALKSWWTAAGVTFNSAKLTLQLTWSEMLPSRPAVFTCFRIYEDAMANECGGTATQPLLWTARLLREESSSRFLMWKLRSQQSIWKTSEATEWLSVHDARSALRRRCIRA